MMTIALSGATNQKGEWRRRSANNQDNLYAICSLHPQMLRWNLLHRPHKRLGWPCSGTPNRCAFRILYIWSSSYKTRVEHSHRILSRGFSMGASNQRLEPRQKEALIRGDIDGIHEIVKGERKRREENKRKKPSR
jgi:hypothetical protein